MKDSERLTVVIKLGAGIFFQWTNDTGLRLSRNELYRAREHP